MKQNMGQLDRIARLVLGIALFSMPLLNIFGIWHSAAFAYIVMLVGLILAVTSIVGVCPLYRLLGTSTKRT